MDIWKPGISVAMDIALIPGSRDTVLDDAAGALSLDGDLASITDVFPCLL